MNNLDHTTHPAIKSDNVSAISKPGLWRWGLALFGLAFVIRLVYALQLPFPPLDDPAYYVQGARSLRSGHFFDMAIVWSYHPVPTSVLHPGFDFWVPLTAFAITPFMAVMGDTPLAGQLPSVLAGSLLATLTFYLGQRWTGRPWLAGLAGLYIAINPILAYQSAVPDSQMLYAVCVAGALLVWPTNQPSRKRAFGLGLLIGLAYLARSHALFLAATWAGWVLWQLWKGSDRRKRTLVEAVITAFGLGLIVVPWLVRNYLTFGFVNSPAGFDSILISDYATLFNYSNPLRAADLTAWLGARGTALTNAWLDVLSVMFLPTVALPIAGAIWLAKRPKGQGFGIALSYTLLMGIALPLIFSVASSTGSFYHSAGSLAPVLAVGLFYLLDRINVWWRQNSKRRTLWPVLVGILLIMELFQFWITIPQTIDTHQYNQTTYARLDEWLKGHPAGQAVIADEPSTLNYATGLPALRLPADENVDSLRRLAIHYNARYVVVTHQFGRYPDLLDRPDNTSFSRIYTDPQAAFFIYALNPA